MRRVVLKIGGSVITDKSKPFTLRKHVLNRIASEIAKAIAETKIRLILVHGGGSFGHFVASRFKNKLTTTSCIEIHEAMERLNRKVVSYLLKHGVKAIPIDTISLFVLKRKHVFKAFLEPIVNALNNDLVPVLYGNVVFDVAEGFSILSGDTIAPCLASKLGFENLFYAIDVDGVYKRYPPRSDDDLLEVLDLHKAKVGVGKIDVTGGMANKLIEIAKWIKGKKVKVILFNALKKNHVYMVLRKLK
ncbi:MAG: hypothetical protein B6U75_03605 [Desulfurococcales archaeon ex4484_217_1]|nr:MAG: hypothetical protein B6U75_03605 [Desulfurococcales archaeon ex4484_217_1]